MINTVESAWVDLIAFRTGGLEVITPEKKKIRERQEKIRKAWKLLESNERTAWETLDLIADAIYEYDFEEESTEDPNNVSNDQDDASSYNDSDASDENELEKLDELVIENDYFEGTFIK